MLKMKAIPEWHSTHAPLYDIHKSYLENADHGPFFLGEIPKRNERPWDQWVDFLDFKLASPIGIAAGPLLNSRWITLAANLGFDLLCYKTIRSQEHSGHSLPNVLFVDGSTQLNQERLPPFITTNDRGPSSIEELAITNSFGMPSRSPQYLKKDIPLAKSKLHHGQLMMVSIVGSAKEKENFTQDFVQTAELAVGCGAQVVEANFSCPNVSAEEGCLYQNPDNVRLIASALVKALKGVPLILKMGHFSDIQQMEKSLLAAARAGARGVCGINTISMKVVNKDLTPSLGHSRPTSGVCGAPIRETAIGFIRSARQINKKHKLGLTLIGVGGVTRAEHFQEFLNAGADIAMTAAGMMWDPYLALRYHQEKFHESRLLGLETV